jgi:hypothetical protein
MKNCRNIPEEAEVVALAQDCLADIGWPLADHE